MITSDKKIFWQRWLITFPMLFGATFLLDYGQFRPNINEKLSVVQMDVYNQMTENVISKIHLICGLLVFILLLSLVCFMESVSSSVKKQQHLSWMTQLLPVGLFLLCQDHSKTFEDTLLCARTVHHLLFPSDRSIATHNKWYLNQYQY